MAAIEDSQHAENLRLHALVVAQATRIRELEDALAQSTARVARLRAMLRYPDRRDGKR